MQMKKKASVIKTENSLKDKPDDSASSNKNGNWSTYSKALRKIMQIFAPKREKRIITDSTLFL